MTAIGNHLAGIAALIGDGPKEIGAWLHLLAVPETRDPAIIAASKAKDQTILCMLGRLALHYWRPDFTPEQAKNLYADYVRDLRPYQIGDIRDSIAAHRRRDAKFYPRVGELLTFIEAPPAWELCTQKAYIAARREAGARELKAIAAEMSAVQIECAAPKQIGIAA
jgi:hypothetical protein